MRTRAKLLARGDAVLIEASELETSPPENLSSTASLRRAARRYTTAADAYKRAGLGIMARRCYASAARCWSAVGEQNLHETAHAWETAIPVYWEDDL